MKFFKNKNNSIRSSQEYSDVAAPGAGGSDPAVSRRLYRIMRRVFLASQNAMIENKSGKILSFATKMN